MFYRQKSLIKTLLQIFVFLLIATNLHADEWRFVGDIEGIAKRFDQLQKEGRIVPNSQNSWDLVDGQSLVFEGDLWKRGPYGVRTVKWVQDLLTRYNVEGSKAPRVVLALGNHDLNTISLIQWLPKMELGEHKAFNDWLKLKEAILPLFKAKVRPKT